MLTKVISGGQTGIDQLALQIAHQYGIPTGGTAPFGYKTEDGVNYELRDKYGLTYSESSNYLVRTIQNIKDADLTVIFGNISSPGSRRTAVETIRLDKYLLINPTPGLLIEWINRIDINTINVAGNRMSNISLKDYESAMVAMRMAFQRFKTK